MVFPLPNMIRDLIGEFNGRSWLLPILKEWLDNGSEQISLLISGSGTGKSMIMG